MNDAIWEAKYNKLLRQCAAQKRKLNETRALLRKIGAMLLLHKIRTPEDAADVAKTSGEMLLKFADSLDKRKTKG